MDYFKYKRIMSICALIFACISLWAPQNIFSQENGFKFIKNYSKSEYRRSPVNYTIQQDARGFIYVGNLSGLLEFDGVSWRVIEINNYTVRSIAIDEDGTIYIGGRDEIGYLKPNAIGALKYKSLLGHIDEKQRDFGTVWSAHKTKEGVYFRTSKFLFRWKSSSREMEVMEPIHRFNLSFVCNGKLLVHQRKVGIMHVIGDSLTLIPGSERFANVKIYMITPYNSNRLLVGTRENGFYLFDYDGTVEPFHTEVDDYLKEKELYHGIKLSSGEFALATLRGGLVIIDSQGKLKRIYNKASGLLDNDVKKVFEDSTGQIWLAMNKGVAKIDYTSPFSIIDDRSGLPGIVLSVGRQDMDLYVGTTDGLYLLQPDSRFRPISGVSSCYSILPVGESVLAASTDGVSRVGTGFTRMVYKSPSYFLYHSQKTPHRIWVGTQAGLVSLQLYKKRWEFEHQFKNITDEIRSIVEADNGDLWLGTLTKGVLKIDYPIKRENFPAVVKRYDKSHGLPDSEVYVVKAARHIMFATSKGIYRFDDKNNNFLPDFTLGDEFADGSKNVFRSIEDNDKNIWFHSGHRNIQAVLNPDGNYDLKIKPFLRLPDEQVNAFYPDGAVVWFASDVGLIRYDTTIEKNYENDYATFFRKVYANGKLIYDGYRGNTNTHSKTEKAYPAIKYKNRNLRFEFAAPFFEAEIRTKYQWLLKGYDDQWSDWSSETTKDYTNLDSGEYTFRVKAKNVYEHLSSEATFQFKILPPWYKTWWAFLVYGLLFFLLMFFVVKWRSGKLEREKKKLEQIVKERTKELEERTTEINEKNIQLESQTVQLKEQSEKLKEMDKVKSRFFANISHEFRTPLTLLMGPLEQMIAACGETEKEKKRKLTLMLRNAQRLLRLINQLLELSKLDSGKMKLQTQKTNMISFVKGIAASFQLLAQQKELELVFQADEDAEDIALYIEPRKMEDVMSNLLINALKFTPPGGEVRVRVTGSTDSVEISVSDTGPGIPAEELANIFDRFYQADTTYEYHQKGSGIGLALAKELVELHGGTIEAKSSEGQGSTFIIHLGNAPTDEQETSVPIEDTPAQEMGMDISETEIESEPEPKFDLDSETGTDEKNIILVVEDSADMREYIKGALEPGYTVVEAGDGKEGIEKAREIIPDLIISDIMMPEKDGNELCRTLKSHVQTSHIPIILLTAKASEENILEGLETGADDYVTKPFSTKILSARIKNLIDIRGQLQQNVKREMTLQPVKTSVSKLDQEFLRDLQAVIKKNLSDPEFNVEELCKKLYMSNTTLYRKIQALSGQTPTDFIRSYRLKRAAQLLKDNFGSVTEVAFEVGFSSRTYFTRCFKEKFHQLPSTYHDTDSQ